MAYVDKNDVLEELKKSIQEMAKGVPDDEKASVTESVLLISIPMFLNAIYDIRDVLRDIRKGMR